MPPHVGSREATAAPAARFSNLHITRRARSRAGVTCRAGARLQPGWWVSFGWHALSNAKGVGSAQDTTSKTQGVPPKLTHYGNPTPVCRRSGGGAHNPTRAEARGVEATTPTRVRGESRRGS